MVGSSPATTMKRYNDGGGEDTSDNEAVKYSMWLETNVREYMSNLPISFEGSACEPLPVSDDELGDDDDDERVRIRCAGHDRDALKGFVVAAEQRWRLSLYELLEQELSLSDAVAEVRYLRGQVSERDDDIEMLRLQLQVADEYSEALLREKADALRKLAEAKKELALISTKAANLQRNLDAKTKWEKELTNSLASTPSTMAADPVRGNQTPDSADRSLRDMDRAAQVRKDILLSRATRLSEMLKHKINNTDNSNTSNNSNNTNHRNSNNNNNSPFLRRNMLSSSGQAARRAVSATPVECDSREHSFRDLSVRCMDPRRACVLSASDDPLRDVACAVVPIAPTVTASGSRKEWRLPYLSSQAQSAVVEREIAAARVCCGAPLSGAADAPQLLHFAQQLQRRLRRTTIELERVARELVVERERTRKQHQLETILLQDVGRLARSLRARENAESTLRAQFRKDASLTRAELLRELQQCRQSLSAMAVRREESLPLQEGGSEKSKTQWVLTEELAAALEEALAASEGLRMQKEYILSEKKMQEVSYEVELRNRVIVMEELTTAMHELREQVSQLRRQRVRRSSMALKSSPARASQCPNPTRILTQDLSNADMTLTSRENAMSEFLNSGLPTAREGNRCGSHADKSLPSMPRGSLHVFNGTR